MSSRIIIHVEDPCTPKQAAEIYNQVSTAVVADRLSTPEIEVVIARGIKDKAAE